MKLFRRQDKDGTSRDQETAPDAPRDGGPAVPEPVVLQVPPEPLPDAAAEPADSTPAVPAPEAVSPSQDDLLAELSAEALNEPSSQETGGSSGDDPATEDDDELDPGLLDIFRDAKNEVEESTLASQLENIAIDDLRSEAVGVGQRLGIKVERLRLSAAEPPESAPAAATRADGPEQVVAVGSDEDPAEPQQEAAPGGEAA